MLYPNVEKHIDEILKIVEKCPEPYKQKCFEVLLQGYVMSTVKSNLGEEAELDKGKKPPNTDLQRESQIPAEILQRFKTFAKRLSIESEKLEKIFDFTVDPFVYQPFTPSGSNAAEKARNIVLILATKSYLTTGNWNADWKEIKSLCVDHNCYDAKNHSTYLQNGLGSVFKSVETGKHIILSPDGQKQAEAAIKLLVEAEA